MDMVIIGSGSVTSLKPGPSICRNFCLEINEGLLSVESDRVECRGWGG